jgi:two-component system CheB/CheR fusion protein
MPKASSKSNGKRRPQAAKVSVPARRENGDLVVVGLGASAGGVQAFTEFFKALPADTGMAFVIIQHLDPTHESMLPDIISRLTSMPVMQVRQTTTIEPNCVYVLPPNREITINDGVLNLSSRIQDRRALPADRSILREPGA